MEEKEEKEEAFCLDCSSHTHTKKKDVITEIDVSCVLAAVVGGEVE